VMSDQDVGRRAMRGVPSGTETTLALWKASRAVSACARDSIEHTGLGLSDFAVLEALLHVGPLAVNAIGRKVFLTSGSITTAVDRLVSRGLVSRTDDPEDRRVRVIALTNEGRRLITPAYAQHEADLEQVVSTLTPSERTTLFALLRKLGRAAAATRGTAEDM
jgi:MarR family 2-MHQ and catechol resistance regulon transcriptional repressor